MASVQELLLALEGQKSPFASLLEGVAGGVATAQDKALENAKTLIALEQNRQEQERQAEMDRQIKAQIEGQTQNALKSTGKIPTVFPAQKLQVEISQDEKGRYSRKFKMAEPKDPGSLDAIAAEKVRSGEMLLEEAYAMKNKGISPALNYQMEKDKEKEAKEAKAVAIPGYKSTGKIVIDETQAKKLRNGLAELETFKEGVSEYRNLINKFGTAEPTDRRVQGQLSAYAKNLQLKVKNLAQLGVLSASDIPFIEEQIPGPGIFKTTEGMLGALDTVEKQMTKSVEKQMKVNGFVQDVDHSTQVPEGKIRVSNGRETLLIDPADAAEAAKDGYQVVQ